LSKPSSPVIVRILGVGCRKCNKTVQRAQEAVRHLGVEAEVVLVKDINEISCWVMLTPGVLIDGKVVAEGYVPTVDMLETWIRQSATKKARMEG